MNLKPETQKEIFESNYDGLFRYCYSRLGNKEQAQDVCAETFLRFLEQENLDPNLVKFWLFRVARNLIVDRYRSEMASYSDEQVEDIEDIQALTETEIEQAALDEKLVQIIGSKLTELDDLTREVITLKIWEDYTFKEVGELVGLKESATKLRYYRGLKKLKDLIEEESKRRKYAFVLPFPLLVHGLSQSSISFLPSSAEKASILSIINTTMENTPVVPTGGVAEVTATTSTRGFSLFGLGTQASYSLVAGGVGLILMVVLALVAVLSMGDREPEAASQNSTSETSESVASSQDSTSSQEEMVTFSSSRATVGNGVFPPYSLQYPESWSLSETKLSNGATGTISLSKGNYELEINSGADFADSGACVITGETPDIELHNNFYYDLRSANHTVLEGVELTVVAYQLPGALYTTWMDFTGAMPRVNPSSTPLAEVLEAEDEHLNDYYFCSLMPNGDGVMIHWEGLLPFGSGVLNVPESGTSEVILMEAFEIVKSLKNQ